MSQEIVPVSAQNVNLNSEIAVTTISHHFSTLLRLTLEFLGPKDIAIVASICKEWCQIVQNYIKEKEGQPLKHFLDDMAKMYAKQPKTNWQAKAYPALNIFYRKFFPTDVPKQRFDRQFYLAAAIGNIVWINENLKAYRNLPTITSVNSKEVFTIWHVAAQFGQREVIEFLSEEFKIPEPFAPYPSLIYLAAKYGHVAIIQFFYERKDISPQVFFQKLIGEDFNFSPSKPDQYFSKQDLYTELVSNPPWYSAIKYNRTQVLEYFQEQFIKANFDKNPSIVFRLLSYAVKGGNTRTIQWLNKQFGELLTSIDINYFYSFIEVVAKNNHLSALKEILKIIKNTEQLARSCSFSRLLEKICHSANVNAVRLLLEELKSGISLRDEQPTSLNLKMNIFAKKKLLANFLDIIVILLNKELDFEINLTDNITDISYLDYEAELVQNLLKHDNSNLHIYFKQNIPYLKSSIFLLWENITPNASKIWISSEEDLSAYIYFFFINNKDGIRKLPKNTQALFEYCCQHTEQYNGETGALLLAAIYSKKIDIVSQIINTNPAFRSSGLKAKPIVIAYQEKQTDILNILIDNFNQVQDLLEALKYKDKIEHYPFLDSLLSQITKEIIIKYGNRLDYGDLLRVAVLLRNKDLVDNILDHFVITDKCNYTLFFKYHPYYIVYKNNLSNELVNLYKHQELAQLFLEAIGWYSNRKQLSEYSDYLIHVSSRIIELHAHKLDYSNLLFAMCYQNSPEWIPCLDKIAPPNIFLDPINSCYRLEENLIYLLSHHEQINYDIIKYLANGTEFLKNFFSSLNINIFHFSGFDYNKIRCLKHLEALFDEVILKYNNPGSVLDYSVLLIAAICQENKSFIIKILAHASFKSNYYIVQYHPLAIILKEGWGMKYKDLLVESPSLIESFAQTLCSDKDFLEKCTDEQKDIIRGYIRESNNEKAKKLVGIVTSKRENVVEDEASESSVLITKKLSQVENQNQDDDQQQQIEPINKRQSQPLDNRRIPIKQICNNYSIILNNYIEYRRKRKIFGLFDLFSTDFRERNQYIKELQDKLDTKNIESIEIKLNQGKKFNKFGIFSCKKHTGHSLKNILEGLSNEIDNIKKLPQAESQKMDGNSILIHGAGSL